jgi:G3E family GTPase
VITVIDRETWLEDATCDDDVAERGLALLPGDERTLAQLVVGQAEFADLIVGAGAAEPWQATRTEAVLARLAPLAPRVALDRLDRRLLLDHPSAGARRGRPAPPHAPLLSGQPTLATEFGVRLAQFTARRPGTSGTGSRRVATTTGTGPTPNDAPRPRCGGTRAGATGCRRSRSWRSYPDPFGWWHTDPCDDITPEPAGHGPVHDQEEQS